jgi:TonB-linked SusC/RagA family outer membrane protein
MRQSKTANTFHGLVYTLVRQPAPRLVCLLLIIAATLFPATGTAQTITMNSKRISLKQVFAEIKKQTGYAVIYNAKVINDNVMVSVSAKDQPFESFIKTVLLGQPIAYKIVGTTIVLRKEEKPASTTGNGQMNEEVVSQATGIILDEATKTGIAGVSVVNKRTGKGTQSDVLGKFTLKETEQGDVLTCTMIGYQPIAIAVDKYTMVFMKIAVNELDKMVIQAYGKTSRRLATGDITRISGEEIGKQSIMNPLLALQGRVPGVIVTPSSGNPSSPVKVVMMGRNSLNRDFSPEPLYIIDGVPQTILDLSNNLKYMSNEGASTGYIQAGVSNTMGQSPLYGIDPKEIESIEVLKDADATSIYGSRGANGVILITTKRAKPGKTSFGISFTHGISNALRRARVLSTEEYIKYRKEAFKNDGILPTVNNAPDLMLWDTTRNTNWQKELFQTAKNTGISATLSGGDIRNSFRLSVNYNDNRAITVGKGKNEAAMIILNAGHASTDQKLRVSVGVSYRFTNIDAVALGGDELIAPNAPAVFDSLGNLNYLGWNPDARTRLYPFGSVNQPNIAKTNILSANTQISYKLLKGLSIEMTGGYTSSRNTNDRFQTIGSADPRLVTTGTAIFASTNTSTWIVEPGIRYSGFLGKGSFEVMAGGSLQNALTTANTITGRGYTNDNLIGTITNAATIQVNDGYGQYKYTAMFGRIAYNWENKYIINLNGRRDGSSRFAPGKQFGNFGSAGVSWNLSEEEWMKRILPSWISFIKIRGSYGITGGDGIGDYQYLARWSAASMLPYNAVRPFTLSQPVNQVYHWQSNKQLAGALEFALWDNRINVSATLQRGIAEDQLTQFPTPQYSGFRSVVANHPAKIRNLTRGLAVDAVLIRRKDFEWLAGFNIGNFSNKLLAYPGLELSPYASIYQIGQSLNTNYLLHYLGIDPLSGEFSFEDYNKDGKISDDGQQPRGLGLDDRYVAINMDPKYDGGFRTALSYKGASISMNFSFRRAWMMASFLTNRPGAMKNIFIPSEGITDYWQKPGDIAKYPRLTSVQTYSISNSDGGYMDISYLQMNNISLSYSLKDGLVRKAGMKTCMLSLTLSNIFTITQYPGIDPVVGLGLPSQKQINGTISFTF